MVLVCFEETPVKRKKMLEKHYPEKKMQVETHALRTEILFLSSTLKTKSPTPDKELLNLLKESQLYEK